VEHWKVGETDWVMDAGHREKEGTFSVVRVGRDSLSVAHWMTFAKKWHETTVQRKLPARW
jgi:hypothetical protein